MQEADAKVAEVARLRPAAAPRWHFVGGLQRNKARAVVRWADLVESVDSVRLADALDAVVRREQEGGRRDRTAPGARPVQRGRRSGRAGCRETGCSPWPTTWPTRPGLRLAGLTSVAPLDADPAVAFADIAAAAAPAAREPSAGHRGVGRDER